MNSLIIGTKDKTARLLERAESRFLLIDDGPIADVFLREFPHAKLFDVSQDTFNPLRDMDYKRARDIADVIYSFSPAGKETLTVRNGKRALVRMLLDKPKALDRLPSDNDPATIEALATIDDLLISPVLRQVLCNPTHFRFRGAVVLKLDRAEIGDFDAYILASLASVTLMIARELKKELKRRDAPYALEE